MDDCALAYMRKHGVPLTRKKYLEMAYLGRPPAELSAEEDAELPEEFQLNWDVFFDRGIQFTHILRLVGEPEAPHVFLAPLGWCAEPRVTEPFEAVPAHSCLVESELGESPVEPIASEIAVQVRSAALPVRD